jgi:putative ATP-binding cassette transporter
MRLLERWREFRRFLPKVARLTLPYFSSGEKWQARGLLLSIVALNLAAVYMLVQINDWNRVFYDALQNKDQPVFWTQLGRFTYLAFAYVIIAVYKFYLTQLLEMRWRAWMTHHNLARWLDHHAYYRMELARFTRPLDAPPASGGPGEPSDNPDNPDQRIQEDLNLFTSHSVSLSMGLLDALVTLASFAGILWALSGPMGWSFQGTVYSIPGFMVWMAVLYCGVGSVLAHYIGRPQIRLNFLQQRFEADFRHHMVRVREYSESIALDCGEAVERQQLELRFSAVLKNYLSLLKAQKNLTGFSVGFSQAAVVFPFIVAAPRFFSGAIQFGELMQIASAFGHVQDALAWFVENYDTLAGWRATTDRLTSFETALSEQKQVHPIMEWSQSAMDSGVPETGELRVALPGGAVLLAGQTLHLAPGSRVLLQGPSGSGKSTLFRALAGIWPFAQGRVQLPARSMFIPQRPYFPNGPLRDALAYPEPASGYTDEALRQALSDALLPELARRLDDADAWGQKLSGGEQQRLAIARVLLRQPRWVFADEATSALDPAAEQILYQQLSGLVARTGGGLVSIAHRPGVAGFHGQTWTLVREPEGAAARYRLVVSGTGAAPA